MSPEITSAILCNYSKLRQESYDRFDSDAWYMVRAFDEIAEKALAEFPLYERLVQLKVDGKQNSEIQIELEKEFGIKHSLEYISSLWRNKIPKLIAQKAKEDYLVWYYRKNNLALKKCSRCGQQKPAHNDFFSKNKTSKDGFYSICKCCRNKKRG